MTDEELTALIRAELDGDLSSQQRGDLARLLLADPRARALRDQLRGVCNRLDAVGQVDPPPQLADSILKRLPQGMPANRQTYFNRWRLAAMVVGLLTAATVIYETVQGPAPASRDIAGTMAAYGPIILDSVPVGSGPVAGRATLYRDKSGLAVGLELSATEPVDLLISTQGHSFVIKGLGASRPGAMRQTVALPGVSMRGQDIELSFLIGDRTVSRATLRAPRQPDERD